MKNIEDIKWSNPWSKDLEQLKDEMYITLIDSFLISSSSRSRVSEAPGLECLSLGERRVRGEFTLDEILQLKLSQKSLLKSIELACCAYLDQFLCNKIYIQGGIWSKKGASL